MLTIEEIKRTIEKIAPDYNLKRVTLFGSRANGNFREDSDVDLIVEFVDPMAVSLLTISSLKITLEEIWGVDVDVISRGGIAGSILIIEREIEVYAA